MGYYQRRKAEVRQESIDWKYISSSTSMDYSTLVNWQYYFYKLGRRYGLLKEFRENGIL